MKFQMKKEKGECCEKNIWSMTLFKSLTFLLLFLSMAQPNFAQAQVTPVTNQIESAVSIGIKAGYDLPLFSTPYKELNYKGGRYIGGHLDYRFSSKWGMRLDYANIKTRPNINIPDSIYYNLDAASVFKNTSPLKRQFVGLGPTYSFGNPKLSFLVSPLIGYAWISGGEALATSKDPKAVSGSLDDILLINTGFKDQVLSAKLDLDLNYAISDQLSLTLGAYYLRHFGVHLDQTMDLGSYGILPIAHGEVVFDHSVNPYTFTNNPSFVVLNNPEQPNCIDLSSIGLTLGLNYTFGKKVRAKPIEEPECLVCPDDKNKVVVKVRDEQSKKVIPNSDVAIKNLKGEIIATGTTNSFGAVSFENIPPGNYSVSGNVYGLETTVASVDEDEFLPNAVIQKEVLYTDLRFILKGATINKNSQSREPKVIVVLTNKGTGNVKQDYSDVNGAFKFRLDKNSTYEVVGNKENRLSDIEAISTLGLTRSTTLFVDLELGMDNFDCGEGTLLDIKYELDEHRLTRSAKFELDRLVNYLKDHQAAKILISSHTDSRGSETYNYRLSRNRAKSTVDYIVSKGIDRNKIKAEGHGERRLLNHCKDGVNCSESQHLINRRTEAQLICN